MEEVKDLKYNLIIAILLLALIFSAFIITENWVEKKVENSYQQGLEEGTQQEKNRIFREIDKELNTFGLYRFPVKVTDGTNTTETFKILIPPSRCPQILNQ